MSYGPPLMTEREPAALAADQSEAGSSWIDSALALRGKQLAPSLGRSTY
jgi:hypothetical protein